MNRKHVGAMRRQTLEVSKDTAVISNRPIIAQANHFSFAPPETTSSWEVSHATHRTLGLSQRYEPYKPSGRTTKTRPRQTLGSELSKSQALFFKKN